MRSNYNRGHSYSSAKHSGIRNNKHNNGTRNRDSNSTEGRSEFSMKLTEQYRMTDRARFKSVILRMILKRTSVVNMREYYMYHKRYLVNYFVLPLLDHINVTTVISDALHYTTDIYNMKDDLTYQIIQEFFIQNSPQDISLRYPSPAIDSSRSLFHTLENYYTICLAFIQLRYQDAVDVLIQIGVIKLFTDIPPTYFHLPFIHKSNWQIHTSCLYNRQHNNRPQSMRSGTNDRQRTPITNAIPSSINEKICFFWV